MLINFLSVGMDGARLFSTVPSDRARDNGHQMEHRKFQMNMRKNLRVTEH